MLKDNIHCNQRVLASVQFYSGNECFFSRIKSYVLHRTYYKESTARSIDNGQTGLYMGSAYKKILRRDKQVLTLGGRR